MRTYDELFQLHRALKQPNSTSLFPRARPTKDYAIQTYSNFKDGSSNGCLVEESLDTAMHIAIKQSNIIYM